MIQAHNQINYIRMSLESFEVNWIYLLAAGLLIGVAKNGNIIKRLRMLTRGKKDAINAVKNKLVSMADLYDYMQELVETTPYKQILIFKMTNGGGDLGIQTQMFIHCLHEVVRHPIQEVKRIDYEPAKSMSETQFKTAASLIENDLLFETKNLPDGIDKLKLEEKGIKTSFMFHIAIRVVPREKGPDREEVHFAVLNSTQGLDEETEFGKISSGRVTTAVETFKARLKENYG